MRVAVISDIHGNRYAFEKVLDAIRDEGADQIVCLGDVATLGAEPLESVRMLASINCACIAGNHDRFIINPESAKAYAKSGPILDAINWCVAELDEEAKKFISGFEKSISFPTPGGDFFIFHGTPGSDEENLLVESAAEVFDSIVAVRDAAVYVSGHSHIRMLRQHYGRLFVNPGSVGSPFLCAFNGKSPTILPQAEYAIIDFKRERATVAFKQILLDMNVIKTSLLSSKNPMARMILGNYSR
jgi:putative phosphoesterase